MPRRVTGLRVGGMNKGLLITLAVVVLGTVVYFGASLAGAPDTTAPEIDAATVPVALYHSDSGEKVMETTAAELKGMESDPETGLYKNPKTGKFELSPSSERGRKRGGFSP